MEEHKKHHHQLFSHSNREPLQIIMQEMDHFISNFVYYTLLDVETETKSPFVGISDTTSVHETWSWNPYVPIGDFLGICNTVKMHQDK